MISIKIEDINEAQRFLCILNLGMLESISTNAMTIHEAYNYLYRPYVSQMLQANGANAEVVKLFEESCLLEDFDDLVPYKLEQALQAKREETVSLLKRLQRSSAPSYWLNEFDSK